MECAATENSVLKKSFNSKIQNAENLQMTKFAWLVWSRSELHHVFPDWRVKEIRALVQQLVPRRHTPLSTQYSSLALRRVKNTNDTP